MAASSTQFPRPRAKGMGRNPPRLSRTSRSSTQTLAGASSRFTRLTTIAATCNNPSCNSAGKHPRTARGFKDASSAPERVHEWSKKWPGANVGIQTGAGSGFFVLDVDGEAGEDVMRTLTAKHGPHPDTLQSATGSGIHIFFRHPGFPRPKHTEWQAWGRARRPWRRRLYRRAAVDASERPGATSGTGKTLELTR